LNGTTLPLTKMLPVCYFVACMTLLQCQQYRQSIEGLFPKETSIDVFYWTNPEAAPVDSTLDFSLQTILKETDDLKHWNFVSPEAQNWLPWYHYDSTQCSAFVKLDSGFIFTTPATAYAGLFQKVAADTRIKHAALANLEPSCSIAYYSGLDSAQILVDLSLMQMLLGVYQTQNINADVKFYTSGGFAQFMSTYLADGEFGVNPVDLTSCSTATTLSTISDIPSDYPFLRLAPSGDMMDTARIQGMINGADRSLKLF
jgi:hypothetical protein